MFNLSKIIKIAREESLAPRIHGTTIEIFHRTPAQQVVGNICETGFIAGGGAAWGVGIYANYTLASALQKFGLSTYGGIVVKGTVNLNGFLIFDYDVAKRIYECERESSHS